MSWRRAIAEPAGDLETLYRRHAGWLGGVLRRQLGHLAADAEDLVQETYLRANRYSAEDAARQPRALLRQIAVNLARDHMRRNVVRGGRALPLDEAGVRQAGERLVSPADQETALLLKQVVMLLPERYRDVFLLSRFTGMSNEEIARHFAISIKTVEWRLSKALAFCAQHMRD